MKPIERHVTAYVEIEVTVTVDVSPGGTAAPRGWLLKRLLSHFHKCSVTLILKQRVCSRIRDENIVESVIVEVADRNPLAVVTLVDSRLLRNVAKGPIATVAKQSV